MSAIDRQRLRRECVATVLLALPLVAGQLSGVGMTVIDTMLAGHLNAHTLGAVSVGANFWVLAYVAAMGVTMALSPSVAQLRGAQRYEQIGPLFRAQRELMDVHGMAEADIDALDDTVVAEMDEAERFADESPPPEPSWRFRHMYVEDEDAHPELALPGTAGEER